jgi:hypothetical protein
MNAVAWTIVGTIVGIALSSIAIFLAMDPWINKKIEGKIQDSDYIRNLAKMIRPISIANGNGNIIYDRGGEDYIRDIVVETDGKTFKSITIKTKQHLRDAPLITIIFNRNYTYRAEKVDTWDWKINFDTPPVVWLEGPDSNISDAKIVIEILP